MPVRTVDRVKRERERRIRKSNYMKRYRLRRYQDGKCQECSEPRLPNGIMCQVHADRKSSYASVRYNELKKKNLCVVCGMEKEKSQVNHTICLTCRQIRSNYRK